MPGSAQKNVATFLLVIGSLVAGLVLLLSIDGAIEGLGPVAIGGVIGGWLVVLAAWALLKGVGSAVALLDEIAEQGAKQDTTGQGDAP